MWNTPPIIDLNAGGGNWNPIDIHINEPLWRVEKNKEKTQLMTLCTQLATFIHREFRHQEIDTFNELSDLCAKLCPGCQVGEALQKMKIDTLFPEVMQCLANGSLLPNGQTDPESKSNFNRQELTNEAKAASFTGYLALMSYFNQVVFLSGVLLRDLEASDSHKYVAHQMVLLHQSVSKCGPHLEDFKMKIERSFARIKEEIEAFDDDRTLLSVELQDWLKGTFTQLEERTLDFFAASDDPRHITYLKSFMDSNLNESLRGIDEGEGGN